ncbi:hypothetical protein KKG31_03455 [Patescibacteria group bacterium]|nr:hypothetical protein [Patescibacteria group bacterium]MBU1758204.1 hypothetical protein [Patescibacteria group bacterium]
MLIGFNIPINANFKKKADMSKVEIKNYDIIYELTDYLQGLVNGMIEIEKEEVVVGKLEVLGIFYSQTKEMVIGGKVIQNKIKNKLKFRILRMDPATNEENIISNGEILSLHKNKDQVKEVLEGDECGIKCHMGKKIEMGDILEFYEMQDIKEEKAEKKEKKGEKEKKDV